MKLHWLEQPAPAPLGQALERFEAQFRYPLGPQASFSISHGRDYIHFFAAIGAATVLVAEDQGEVLATLAAVLRPLRLPGGRVEPVAYLADLKMSPAARGSTLLGRVLTAMRDRLSQPSGGRAYGVVMEGTGATPLDYTGRLGIPRFARLASLMILRLDTRGPTVQPGPPSDRMEQVGFVPLGGRPELRSEMTPLPLSNEGASGLLEDTRRGKRLLIGPGQEMRAAHLSRLAWRDPSQAARLIEQAAGCCADAGVPTLFVCMPAGRVGEILPRLEGRELLQAPATVYGCGLDCEGEDWWVDSAEI